MAHNRAYLALDVAIWLVPLSAVGPCLALPCNLDNHYIYKLWVGGGSTCVDSPPFLARKMEILGQIYSIWPLGYWSCRITNPPPLPLFVRRKCVSTEYMVFDLPTPYLLWQKRGVSFVPGVWGLRNLCCFVLPTLFFVRRKNIFFDGNVLLWSYVMPKRTSTNYVKHDVIWPYSVKYIIIFTRLHGLSNNWFRFYLYLFPYPLPLSFWAILFCTS